MENEKLTPGQITEATKQLCKALETVMAVLLSAFGDEMTKMIEQCARCKDQKLESSCDQCNAKPIGNVIEDVRRQKDGQE